MTLATASNQQASESYQLVQLIVGYLFDTTEWTATGVANRYVADWDKPVESFYLMNSGTRVEFNDTTVLPTVDQQYWFDEANGKLYIYSLLTPATYRTSVDFYLFLTHGRMRVDYEEPSLPGLVPLRYWEPRLRTPVSISQTASDTYFGVFSFSGTNIRLINDDNALTYLLDAKKYSVSNRFVDIWGFIDSSDNIGQIYRGRCKDINEQGSTIGINVYDEYSTIGQLAYMGDPPEEALTLRNGSSYPDVDPDQNGAAIPFHFGKQSYASYQSNDYFSGAGTATTSWLTNGHEATNIDFQNTTGSSVNREWVLGRSRGLRTQNMGSFVREIDYPFFGSQARFVNLSGNDLRIGETFQFDNGGTKYVGIVAHTGTFTYGGNTYNLVIYFPQTWIGIPAVGSSTLIANKGLSVWYSSTSVPYLQPARLHDEYTVTESATSGGNYVVKVTFDASFSITPKSTRIYYQMNMSADETHTDVVDQLGSAAGLSINVTDATSLSANVAMSIPEFGRKEYETYADYLAAIMVSTGGYLSISTAGAIKYRLFPTSISSPTEVTDDDMLDRSITLNVDYQNAFARMRVINGQNPYINTYSEDTLTPDDGPALLAQSALERDFVHVLTSGATAKAQAKAARTEPALIVTFSTKTKLIAAVIGDEIRITSRFVPDGSIDCVVIGTNKDAESVTITALRV